MPWEKTFDTDAVLDRAAEVFAVKGYEATSISDLLEGMGINKGSLYNTFGSKRDLFRSVLVKFVEQQQAQVLQRLLMLDDPLAAILAPFDVIMEHSLSDQQLKGALIVSVAQEFPNHDTRTQSLVLKSINNLEGFFRSKIEDAQQTGIIEQQVDSMAAAKSLTTLAVGFRVLSRGAFDAQELHAVKGNALQIVGISGASATR